MSELKWTLRVALLRRIIGGLGENSGLDCCRARGPRLGLRDRGKQAETDLIDGLKDRHDGCLNGL